VHFVYQKANTLKYSSYARVDMPMLAARIIQAKMSESCEANSPIISERL
jgi:hypothetical protein